MKHILHQYGMEFIEEVKGADMPERDYAIIDLHRIDEIVNTKCVIYGAGKYGTRLYALIKLKGLNRYITAFAVSSREGNPVDIDGIPVKAVEEIEKELADCNVLVAIGNTRIQDVFDLLQNYRVRGIYRVTNTIMELIPQEAFHEMKSYPLEQNKIFISCYEGMGYRCNCKYIAEKLLQGNYPVKIVWVVEDEKTRDIPEGIKQVILFTAEYYRELYTSKICITNNTTRLFGEKKEGQYYINTWHGFGPFKKVQASVTVNKERYHEIKETNSKYDLFLTGSVFYSQVYRNSFFYEGEICECGAPRNDVFFTENTIKELIYEKFEIPFDKKILLYAPTFRTNVRQSFDKYDLNMQEILEALQVRFGGEYVLMYRFHHHLYCDKKKCGHYYENGIDATYYPDIQELLVAADVVLTDYSSLMWDFSLQRKPVFLYQNDEEDYADDRGFYCPVSQWPYPRAHSKQELSEVIKGFDYERYIEDLNRFLEKYGSCDSGNASEKVAERIMKVVNGEN